MLRIVLIVLLLCAAPFGEALASVDYQCMGYCKNNGYDNTLCREHCTIYDDDTKQSPQNEFIQNQSRSRHSSRMDFLCLSDCIKKRRDYYDVGPRLDGEISTSGYCRRECSY